MSKMTLQFDSVEQYKEFRDSIKEEIMEDMKVEERAKWWTPFMLEVMQKWDGHSSIGYIERATWHSMFKYITNMDKSDKISKINDESEELVRLFATDLMELIDKYRLIDAKSKGINVKEAAK